MSRGRKPRPEELDLWRKVAETTEALEAGQKVVQPETRIPDPDPVPKAAKINGVPQRLGAKRQSPIGHDFAPQVEDRLGRMPVEMDRKAFGKMIKGRLSPDARIDLHGMTLDRAHAVLRGFVMSQYASGSRLLLVITGKGKVRDEGGPIPVRLGVLRHQVPHWLTMAPLAPMVLQVTPAHRKHGGTGAYYVYLRRKKA